MSRTPDMTGWSRAEMYQAAAVDFGRIPTGMSRAALLRLHREHLRRARHGRPGWHLAHAAAIRRAIVRAPHTTASRLALAA